MSADLDRMAAAQAKADAVIRQVADHDGSDSPRLLVAVTDPETNTRLATGFAAYQTTPRTPARRPVAATSPDRGLLAAVVEALTLPFGADGYEQRIAARAGWVRTTLDGVLTEGEPEWHAEYLRRKLREEEARHGGDRP